MSAAPQSAPAPVEFTVPDPRSFYGEPITADEVAITDPAHLAHTLNAYAKALVEQGLAGMFEVAA